MSEWQLNTSVVLFIFNRPDTTEKVFEAIRHAKPPKLFVIADGHRAKQPGETEKCAAARSIVERVDWECEVLRNYSEINMGSGRRVSTGITWVFEQVDEAIFLEDDCLPDLTFFRFCSDLLKQYKNDNRVMMISGTNNLVKWQAKSQSYHFSYFGSIWGWASWKRAWVHYDYELKILKELEISKKLCEILLDNEKVKYVIKTYQKTLNGEIDTWDYQWLFSRLLKAGLSIVPSTNLVSNIGFGKNATHTINCNITNANLCRYSIAFPLKYSTLVTVDREYDHKYFLKTINKPDIDSIIFQTVELLNAHRNIHALLLLEKAIAAKPDMPGLKYGKAIALARLGQINGAIEALNYLLNVMPGHRKARLLLNEIMQVSKPQK